MIKKALLALAITGAMATAQATVVVNEGFDDVSTLSSKGWILSNQSSPVGSIANWFQGGESLYNAQDGAANSYIGANYNNGQAGGILNLLLETPVFSTASGVIVSFYLNSALDGAYFDQIAFGFVDASGVFTSALANLVTVTTGAWTQYTVTMANTVGSARFAIDYVGSADNASNVGIDSLTVTVPEPSSIAILAAGLMGLGAVRRRQKRG